MRNITQTQYPLGNSLFCCLFLCLFYAIISKLTLKGSQKNKTLEETTPRTTKEFRSLAATMEFFATSGNASSAGSIFTNTFSTITTTNTISPISSAAATPRLSRYENQKRRDWNTFCQYLRNHRPPLSLSLCSGAHVLEFLRYLDQFGKTKVHNQTCPFFGMPNPPAPCPCPVRQAWGSLDALIGRLRAAYEEHGGKPEVNPFGTRAVRLFLRDVRDFQSKSRGISYEKKRKRSKQKVAALQTNTGATLCGKTNVE